MCFGLSSLDDILKDFRYGNKVLPSIHTPYIIYIGNRSKNNKVRFRETIVRRLYRVKENINIITVKSLILAQDER